MTGTRAIRRALISVYDKTGLEDLARGLDAAGVQIVSTGSTAAKIAEAGAEVTKVEDLTGFPECLEGRVKTLHPRVHAGILADSRKPDHRSQLDELGIEPFDLVIVNLYPFSDTVASGAGFDDCVEQIDIGGPSMVRAAAKNHPTVAVVTDPADYSAVIEAASGEGFGVAARREFAARAFAHTAAYDTAVASWFAAELSGAEDSDGDEADQPAFAGVTGEKIADLRLLRRHPRHRLCHAAGRQGDVVQQLHRHRCRDPCGLRLRPAGRGHRQTREPLRHRRRRHRSRRAQGRPRMRSALGIRRGDRHQS